jgi:aryl-alcohol dehydrogenase-like predicted oxidoreductase
MKYRRLGKTEIFVSEIGFGAWGIGGISKGATSYGLTDDGSSIRALNCALDSGINFFDTSNVYGDGHSENLIGKTFLKARDRVLIATKVGLINYEEPADFSIKNLSQSLQNSLKRLKTDYIDLLQLHNPSPHIFQQNDEILNWVGQLIKKGIIRAFGVSVKSPEEGIGAIEHLKAESIQVNFNLLDHRAIDSGLMKSAAKNHVSLIARTPLSFGFLSGKLYKTTHFDKQDHRSRWPSQQIENWIEGSKKMLSCKTNSFTQTDTQFALRFCLSYPQIATTIPGILNNLEVKENIKASDLGPLKNNEAQKVQKTYYEIRSLFEKKHQKKTQIQGLGKVNDA